MKIKRVFLAFMCALASSAFAQKITVKIASIAPARSPWDIEQKKMAKEWAEITNGNINLMFYDVNSQGGEAGVIRKMRLVRPGQPSPIDGAVFTNIGAYELAPESNILTLAVPFLFNDTDECNYILDKFHGEMSAAYKQKGYILLGWFTVGWGYYYTKEEARTPDQIKALRMCSGGMASPELGKAFQLAGYTTEDIPFDKVLQSIKSANGVQALYSIPMYGYAVQYYKSLNYIIDKPLFPILAAFVVTENTWNKIPEQYKKDIMASVEKTKQRFIEVQNVSDREYIDKMVEDGATLVKLTESEDDLWRKSLTGDVKAMGQNPNVKAINYDFFLRVSKELEAYRASK